MKSPRVSVAMATYNGEKYLKAQLDSLAAQTVLPFELVVCDDGSTDGTIQIIREFASVAPFPVRVYINETNLGYSDNFLKAAGLCEGDWISFCDQDDVWLPKKFERVADLIRRHPGDELVLIGHTSLMAGADLEPNGRRLPDFRRDEYIERASNYGFFCVVGFSMTCQATLVRQIDHSLRPRKSHDHSGKSPGHDQWLGLLANALGDMACISEPLAIWRRHESSLTRPPGSQDILEKAKVAKVALRPDPYVLQGNMAKETSDALRNIASKTPNPTTKERLLVASANFLRLADNMARRGDLYARRRQVERVTVFSGLLKQNAYTGPKFYSLGWKSLVKDAAFACGIIG